MQRAGWKRLNICAKPPSQRAALVWNKRKPRSKGREMRELRRSLIFPEERLVWEEEVERGEGQK